MATLEAKQLAEVEDLQQQLQAGLAFQPKDISSEQTKLPQAIAGVRFLSSVCVLNILLLFASINLKVLRCPQKDKSP